MFGEDFCHGGEELVVGEGGLVVDWFVPLDVAA